MYVLQGVLEKDTFRSIIIVLILLLVWYRVPGLSLSFEAAVTLKISPVTCKYMGKGNVKEVDNFLCKDQLNKVEALNLGRSNQQIICRFN